MRGYLFFVLLAAVTAGPRGAAPLDVAEVVARAQELHNQQIQVRGIVTSVCPEEGCFIDIVPLSGKGDGILVSARDGSFQFPRDCVGRVAVVTGTFFNKVYPLSRMEHWHHHGWRAREKNLPAFSVILRVEADSVDFTQPRKAPRIQETPLAPFASPMIPLDHMEFEAARMGTGKKCLAAGEQTPEHSTGRYHELLFGLTGSLSVSLEGVSREIVVSQDQACYVPPNTRHFVSNHGTQQACYIFVYSLPEAQDTPHQTSD